MGLRSGLGSKRLTPEQDEDEDMITTDDNAYDDDSGNDDHDIVLDQSGWSTNREKYRNTETHTYRNTELQRLCFITTYFWQPLAPALTSGFVPLALSLCNPHMMW